MAIMEGKIKVPPDSGMKNNHLHRTLRMQVYPGW